MNAEQFLEFLKISNYGLSQPPVHPFKEKWAEILEQLDPEDFSKYKM